MGSYVSKENNQSSRSKNPTVFSSSMRGHSLISKNFILGACALGAAAALLAKTLRRRFSIRDLLEHCCHRINGGRCDYGEEVEENGSDDEVYELVEQLKEDESFAWIVTRLLRCAAEDVVVAEEDVVGSSEDVASSSEENVVTPDEDSIAIGACSLKRTVAPQGLMQPRPPPSLKIHERFGGAWECFEVSRFHEFFCQLGFSPLLLWLGSFLPRPARPTTCLRLFLSLDANLEHVHFNFQYTGFWSATSPPGGLNLRTNALKRMWCLGDIHVAGRHTFRQLGDIPDSSNLFSTSGGKKMKLSAHDEAISSSIGDDHNNIKGDDDHNTKTPVLTPSKKDCRSSETPPSKFINNNIMEEESQSATFQSSRLASFTISSGALELFWVTARGQIMLARYRLLMQNNSEVIEATFILLEGSHLKKPVPFKNMQQPTPEPGGDPKPSNIQFADLCASDGYVEVATGTQSVGGGSMLEETNERSCWRYPYCRVYFRRTKKA